MRNFSGSPALLSLRESGIGWGQRGSFAASRAGTRWRVLPPSAFSTCTRRSCALPSCKASTPIKIPFRTRLPRLKNTGLSSGNEAMRSRCCLVSSSLHSCLLSLVLVTPAAAMPAAYSSRGRAKAVTWTESARSSSPRSLRRRSSSSGTGWERSLRGCGGLGS